MTARDADQQLIQCPHCEEEWDDRGGEIDVE